jgi:topoisomerase-4 subunit A
MVDVSLYDHGNGKIRCRARMEEANEKTILIKEIPYTTTTQSLIDSVEKAAKAGKIKIISINDYTAEEVEIEIKLARGIYSKDTIKALYAFTDCEVPISPNLTLVQDGVPRTATVEEVLHHNTEKLLADLTRELEIDKKRLEDRLHARLLEQIFIEERIYKTIEEKTSYKAVIAGVDEALEAFKKELKRPVVTEDIERLLEIRIKRISRYDINKQKKEIKSIRADIRTIKTYLKDMVGFTINYIDTILNKYGESYPRLTELKEFTEVSVRRVALSNLTVCYDSEQGFLGHQIKASSSGKADFSIPCSEYDRLLLIYESGIYKVVQVIDKLFVGHDVRWVGKIKKGLVFNMVYREGRENLCYVKRFATPKFILDKEYKLFDNHKRSKILLLTFGEEKSARASLMPSPRAKSNLVEIIFDDYIVKGPGAKGKRVSTRIVRRVVDTTGKKPKEKKVNLSLPGMEIPAPVRDDKE